MTVFLSFLVFLNVVTANLPTNSESIPLLGVYLEIQLGYSIVVLIATSVQLRIHHRSNEQKVSRWYGMIIRISSIRNCNSTQKVYPDGKDSDMKMEPSQCEGKQTSTQVQSFTYRLDHQSSKTHHEKPRATDIVSNKEEEHVQSLDECSTDNSYSKYTWKDVSSALDVIFFWVFLASNCLMIIFFGILL
jgi:hypothetical protein